MFSNVYYYQLPPSRPLVLLSFYFALSFSLFSVYLFISHYLLLFISTYSSLSGSDSYHFIYCTDTDLGLHCGINIVIRLLLLLSLGHFLSQVKLDTIISKPSQLHVPMENKIIVESKIIVLNNCKLFQHWYNLRRTYFFFHLHVIF